MSKGYPFGDALARARRERGHASAYAFYRACGGARVLKLAFSNYLAIERGRSLPKGHRVKTILDALGIAAGTETRAALVRIYLLSLTGEASLLDELGASKPSRVSLEGELARLAVRQRAVNFTLEQWRALAQDETAYFVCAYLQNTPGLVSIADIAAALRAREPKIRAALERLASAKLVEVLGRRARHAFPDRLIQPLPAVPATAGLKAAINRHFEAFVARGKTVRDFGVLVRMPARRLDRYAEHLDETLSLSSIYGDSEKAEDSALYGVEAVIRKISG